MTICTSKLLLGAAAIATGLAAPISVSFAQVDELLVTTQRREQSLQTVPVPVSAFTLDQLDIRQANETLDLVRMVPNLVGHGNTGPGTANAYFMRGLGNTETVPTFDPPVSTYIDDVYVGRQNANNYALFDVERIEVLRGPQGTTFGRNTTGGAINIITRRPSDEFGASGTFEYGRFDRFAGNGTIDVPLSDMVLTKVSGFYVEDDGYVDNITTGETLNDDQSWGVRGDIRFLPTDSVTWDVAVEYLDQASTNVINNVAPFKYSGGIRKDCGSPGNLDDLLLAGCGLGFEAQTLSVYSNLQFDTPIGELSFITGYRDLDNDFTLDFTGGTSPVGGFTIVNSLNQDQFSQEIKLVGDIGDRFSYIAGLFYFDEDNTTDFTDIIPLIPFVCAPCILISRTLENGTKNYSGYFQGDLDLTSKLTFTAGVRWTEEDKDIDFTPIFTAGSVVDGALVLNSFSTSDIEALNIPINQTTAKWTPRFALQYQATDEVMFFASATNGFKSGGWNARATAPGGILPFGPEETWSYELGMKGDFFDNRLRINTNVFYMEVEDLQLITGVFVPPSVLFLTQNAGELHAWGVETEIFASPIENLDLFLSVGYIDDEYKKLNPFLAPLDLEPVRTPDWTVAFGGNYAIPVSNLGSVILGTDAAWIDEHWVSTLNDPVIGLVEPNWTLQGRAGFESEDGSWALFGECKNCTDEVRQSSAFIGRYFNEPRRWNVSLRVRY